MPDEYTYEFPDGSELSVEREVQRLWGSERKPDPKWKFTDDEGHRHYYWDEDDPWPTLNMVIEGDEACESDYCYGCAREIYHCTECGEEIYPKWITKDVSTAVTTFERYTLKREITKEEAEKWAAKFQTDEQQRSGTSTP